MMFYILTPFYHPLFNILCRLSVVLGGGYSPIPLLNTNKPHPKS